MKNKIFTLIIWLTIQVSSLVGMEPSKNIFTFEPLQAEDLPMLHKWFDQKYISDLWKESSDFKEFTKKYQDHIAHKNDVYPYLAKVEKKTNRIY